MQLKSMEDTTLLNNKYMAECQKYQDLNEIHEKQLIDYSKEIKNLKEQEQNGLQKITENQKEIERISNEKKKMIMEFQLLRKYIDKQKIKYENNLEEVIKKLKEKKKSMKSNFQALLNTWQERCKTKENQITSLK
jgi:hypothetical protein